MTVVLAGRASGLVGGAREGVVALVRAYLVGVWWG